MVHQPGDKRKQGKRGSGAAKPDRRADIPDPIPDVSTTGLPSSEPVWVKRDDGKIEVDVSRLHIEELRGLSYIPGVRDCGSLIKNFFFRNAGMDFLDVARPDDWWRHGLNLFYEIARDEGFRPVDIAVSEMKHCDIMLMAYGCSFPNHSGLYVGEGKILQHVHGKLSTLDPIRSHNRDALLAIMRHPDIIIKSPPEQTLNLLDMISPYWKGRLAQRLGGANDDQIKEEIKRIGQEHAARQAEKAPPS